MVCAAAVAVPTPVTAVTSSLLLVVVVADDIPVATETTPVPAVAPVARAMVGWEVTSTPVTAEPVVAVPRPVMTVPPLPLDERLPVATVLAVPRVGAVPLPPEIIKVSASVPLPIAKDQVDAAPALVTLGTVVVASLLVAPG